MKLTPRQYQAAKKLGDNKTEEVLFGGAAGGGKSAFGAIFLLDRCTRLEGSRWLMGRSRLKTLKETTLATFYDVSRAYGMRINKHYKVNNQSNIITFSNGSEILMKDLFAYPSDPEFEDLGSLEITGAFIDECSQVTRKAKDIVKSRIRYRVDEFKVIPKMLMTCNPSKAWTYHDFYKPHRDNVLPPERAFIPALVTDNPHISPHYIKSLKSLDKVSRQRLLYGNWEYDDNPNRLMEYDAIIDLFRNDHIDFEKQPMYITADIARLGSDKAVIIVWQGYKVLQIITLPKSRLNEIADLIQKLRKEYKVPRTRVLVDEDGMGGGLVDYEGYDGFINGSKAVNGENFMNLKTQCYYKLAEKVNKGEIWIADDTYRDEIVEELETVQSYKIDSDTKIRMLPKDKVKELIGRSPDFSDALMMRLKYDLIPNYGEYYIG